MKKWLFAIIPLIALLVVIGLRVRGNNEKKVADAKVAQARLKAPPVVAVSPALVRDIIHTYEAVGSVESPSDVRIAPKITGRVVSLTLREGDPVRQGQVVATIDTSQLLAQVSQQRAQVAEAQQRLAQAQFTTNPTNVNIVSTIQQQQATLASTIADDNQTRTNYASTGAAAQAAVTDAQGRVDNATAAIANADASIRAATSNLTNAGVRYDRTNGLYKQGFVAAQDVDDARTTVEVQQGALDVAKGQRDSAVAARNSALAQKGAAQNQLSIAMVKGKADIAAADARVMQARAALRLALSNRAQKPAYQANLAALRAALDAAQAQFRNAEAQLSETTLRSPVNGFVTARYVDSGSIVAPGTPVLAIQTIKSLYVTASVTEEVSRFIKVGQEARMVFDALPDRTYVGKIAYVNVVADPQNHLFSIRIALDNAQRQVRPGMFARMTLVTEHFQNVIVVPREAVNQGRNGPTVTVIDQNNRASVRPVRVGPQDTTGTAILSGVATGERVVTISVRPVKNGDTVRIERAGPGGGR